MCEHATGSRFTDWCKARSSRSSSTPHCFMHPAHESKVFRLRPCLHVVMNVWHMKVVSLEDLVFRMFLEAPLLQRTQSNSCPPAAGKASIQTMKVNLEKIGHTLEMDRLNANSRDPETLFTNVGIRKNQQGAQNGYILICSTNKIGMLFCLH